MARTKGGDTPLFSMTVAVLVAVLVAARSKRAAKEAVQDACGRASGIMDVSVVAVEKVA